MVKTFKNVSMFIFLITMMVLCLKTVNYKADDSITSQVGFYSKAIIPDNQMDRGKTYFDLKMNRNDNQTILVEIGSLSDEEISIKVEVNGAKTNQAGGVDYQLDENVDKENLFKIENIASVSESNFLLTPGEIKVIEINLKMPEKEFDGEIIGGIVIKKENKDADKDTSVLVENAYNYVIGLVLTENDKEVLPDLELLDVTPDIVNYRTAVVHSIVNKGSRLMKNATMDIKVYDVKNNFIIWENKIDTLTMAPNSTMDYTFYLENEKIIPGTYISTVKIEWEDQFWEFKEEFVVKEDKADMINNNSVNFNDDSENKIPFLAISLLLILLILLVVVIYSIVKILNKDKKENDIKGE